MFQRRVDFVFELLAVDGTATAARSCRVASLDHEVWDYAVNHNVVVVASLGKRGEVFTSLLIRQLIVVVYLRPEEYYYLGSVVVVEFHDYGTLGTCLASKYSYEATTKYTIVVSRATSVAIVITSSL